MLQTIRVSSDPNAHRYVIKEDAARIKISYLHLKQSTIQARKLQRKAQIDVLEAAIDLKDLLYSPGIDDSV